MKECQPAADKSFNLEFGASQTPIATEGCGKNHIPRLGACMKECQPAADKSFNLEFGASQTPIAAEGCGKNHIPRLGD